MSDFLFHYQPVEPTTWVYLSSLLLIGLFFKFGRLWSVRNLDLLLLILLGPGLLMIHRGQLQQGELAVKQAEAEVVHGSDPESPNETPSVPVPDSEAKDAEPTAFEKAQELEVWGFMYLFGVGGLTLTRLLLDAVMVRRPLLEPNLSQGGLLFIGISLFVFLMANVIVEPEPAAVTQTADFRIDRVAPASTQGPGYELLSVLPLGLSKAFCITGQLLIVVGMVLVGFWHFRNLAMGIGAATLYLMLPYTSILTGRIEHILPAATLVWAVLMYRRPLVAGALIGLASGLVYYPFFLLPLWLSFYWHRGFRRFLTSYLTTLAILGVVLSVFAPNGLVEDLTRMLGAQAPAMKGLAGIWNTDAGGFDANYRLPVLVGFIAFSISMSLWPAQKNLGTLLSCTAAIMVAAQFWHGYGGGTYMAWYLPLLLLTIFRPNLEDRVAVSVLGEGWFSRKKLQQAA